MFGVLEFLITGLATGADKNDAKYTPLWQVAEDKAVGQFNDLALSLGQFLAPPVPEAPVYSYWDTPPQGYGGAPTNFGPQNVYGGQNYNGGMIQSPYGGY